VKRIPHQELIEDVCARTTEVATLLKQSMQTIIVKRRKLGVKCPTTWGLSEGTLRPFNGVPAEPVEIVPPEIWKYNKPWWLENYAKYGIPKLAKMIGKRQGAVIDHLRYLGIPRNTTRRRFPENPCCNKDWLEEHYIIRGKTLRECAELANVNAYTIYNWLATFSLLIRESSEYASTNGLQYVGNLQKKNNCSEAAVLPPSEPLNNQS
jgi:hypothetical protein